MNYKKICNDHSKEIYNLQSLFYIMIKVESYKTKSPTKWFAHQGYGHFLANYRPAADCIK